MLAKSRSCFFECSVCGSQTDLILSSEKASHDQYSTFVSVHSENLRTRSETVNRKTIGIIGAGAFAMGRMPRLLVDPRFKLVGLHDVSKCAQANFQSHHYHENIPFFASIESLLACARPDLLWITTTAPSHLEIATAILESESNSTTVLIEKPISNNLQAARDFCSFCQVCGGDVAVDYPRRAIPAYHELRRIVSDGVLGNVETVTVDGIGAVSMNGSHFLDLALFLTDIQPTAVFAAFTKTALAHHRGARFSEPFGRVRIETHERLQVLLNMRQPTGAHEHVIRICGTAGSATIREKQGVIDINGHHQLRFSPSVDDWIFDYLVGVSSGAPFVCRPVDASRSLEIIAAAFVSHEHGAKAVALPLTGRAATSSLRIA
ncbi:MAG: Gfo/Idh/MocA family oxidoreductase [Fuerstiella sp.]